MRRDTHHQGLWRPQFLSTTWLNNFPSVVATPFTREDTDDNRMSNALASVLGRVDKFDPVTRSCDV
jgi:hypothetical protein